MTEGIARTLPMFISFFIMTVILTAILQATPLVDSTLSLEVGNIDVPETIFDIPGFVADVSSTAANIVASFVGVWIDILGSAGIAAPLVAVIPLTLVILAIILIRDIVPFV